MKTNSATAPALYIGIDVHKEKTSFAIADPRSKSEATTAQVALDRQDRRHGAPRSHPSADTARRTRSLKRACPEPRISRH